MIPETNGTMALFDGLDGVRGDMGYRPVVAWDDEGYALVPGFDGRLARAQTCPGFQNLDTGTAQDAVPTTLIPGGGWIATLESGDETPVIAWGVGRDGLIRPFVHDGLGLVGAEDYGAEPFTLRHQEKRSRQKVLRDMTHAELGV